MKKVTERYTAFFLYYFCSSHLFCSRLLLLSLFTVSRCFASSYISAETLCLSFQWVHWRKRLKWLCNHDYNEELMFALGRFHEKIRKRLTSRTVSYWLDFKISGNCEKMEQHTVLTWLERESQKWIVKCHWFDILTVINKNATAL